MDARIHTAELDEPLRGFVVASRALRFGAQMATKSYDFISITRRLPLIWYAMFVIVRECSGAQMLLPNTAHKSKLVYYSYGGL